MQQNKIITTHYNVSLTTLYCTLIEAHCSKHVLKPNTNIKIIPVNSFKTAETQSFILIYIKKIHHNNLTQTCQHYRTEQQNLAMQKVSVNSPHRVQTAEAAALYYTILYSILSILYYTLLYYTIYTRGRPLYYTIYTILSIL